MTPSQLPNTPYNNTRTVSLLDNYDMKYPHAVREAEKKGGFVFEDLFQADPELCPVDGGGDGGREGRLGGEIYDEQDEEEHSYPRLEQHVVVNVCLDLGLPEKYSRLVSTHYLLY